mmetsp:Transcript_15880/g.23914  ORF Transcript_15880/g.23914 Transcript_15880/m.23914 type:complete len:507 (+) Transcript_15880:126-1646(+)|eukprot:CAMPEP_0185031462 /NCGR_PEP_ID=MMETSP1103-20130426/18950_1 /TAXON_ID=36769 /ORGANISM="Paraphysomonas bandaiensis, Strain Caron Lab Isolate" /LENGTH=506 /DNA_ID=CAMNT_0027566999 /DNA_START=38 /DNA_END=1558 /DNA_ORIENTATION=-
MKTEDDSAEVESDEEWEDAACGDGDSSGDVSVEVEVDNGVESLSHNQKRKRRRIIRNEKEFIDARMQHREEVEVMLRRARLVAEWTFDDSLVASVLSLLPYDANNIDPQTQSPLSRIKAVMDWFDRSFRALDPKDVTVEEGRDGCSYTEGLSDVLTRRNGSPHQLCQVFIAALVATGEDVRYTCTIDPTPPIPSIASPETIPLAWAEVLVSGYWINADPVRRLLGNKAALESSHRVRRSAVAYVVSITRGGHVIDVTGSYARRPDRTKRKRVSHPDDVRWWEALSQSEGTAAAVGILPCSIEGFKAHPEYVLGGRYLDRHTLRPGARVIAIFRGIPVYRRSDVSELLTKTQWSRTGRVIGVGAEPEGVDGRGRALFAEWQTESQETDVVLPVNKYGCVEIRGGKSPPGCVYISSPHGERVAREVGIPFASAVVGFRSVGVMKHAPVIDGIVVLQDHGGLIRDAVVALETQLAEQSQEMKFRVVLKRWERLVMTLASRERLRSEYGH